MLDWLSIRGDYYAWDQKMNKVIAIIFLSGCAHLPTASGNCPDSFPIKGNGNSYLYYMPDSEYYGKTNAELCFKSEKDARRMGYGPVQIGKK